LSGETNENLTRLNQDLVAIESRPKDAELLASIFRTFHTIKGTTGFPGFSRLESLTHIAENILSQVRNSERDLTPELVSLILETTDVVTGQLAVIESTGQESPVSNADLEARLRRFAEQAAQTPAAPEAEPAIEDAAEPEIAPAVVADQYKKDRQRPIPLFAWMWRCSTS
jgi:two-component system chemotaxis sensor kinase CheA